MVVACFLVYLTRNCIVTIPINFLEQVIFGSGMLNLVKSRIFDPSCADNCRKAQNMVARSPRQRGIKSCVVGEAEFG